MFLLLIRLDLKFNEYLNEIILSENFECMKH